MKKKLNILLIVAILSMGFFSCKESEKGSQVQIEEQTQEQKEAYNILYDCLERGCLKNGTFVVDENGIMVYRATTLKSGKLVDFYANMTYKFLDGSKSGKWKCSKKSERTETEVKTVNWGDGNSYEYSYTEEINFEDINGEVTRITIYINPKNSNPNCNNKKCKWCNTIIYSTNSYIEEFPNLSNLRENPNRESLADLVLSLGFNVKNYLDADNTNGISIRTEIINHCEYDEVNGYCSNKCYHEAN